MKYKVIEVPLWDGAEIEAPGPEWLAGTRVEAIQSPGHSYLIATYLVPVEDLPSSAVQVNPLVQVPLSSAKEPATTSK